MNVRSAQQTDQLVLMQHGAPQIPSTDNRKATPSAKTENAAELQSARDLRRNPSRTRPAKLSPRGGLARQASQSPALRRGTVTAEELQSAVLLVLALYASIALLNLRAEFASLVQHWQSVVEFLANILLSAV